MIADEHTLLAARNWPHREASIFINSGALRWHVQRMGSGPCVLLLHGTGASTHSWAGLAEHLVEHFEIIAVDLPGHGFTELADENGMSLPGMAALLSQLLHDLEVSVDVAVGHSAGAALLARMCLDLSMAPVAVISINGAMLPLPGLARKLYPGAARLLAALPGVPKLVARHGSQKPVVQQLLRQTGSAVNDQYVEHYQTLVSSAEHVNGAIQMMANWNLDTLEQELPGLAPALYLLACKNDKAVPFAQAARLKVQLPQAVLKVLPELGHLGHEEDPEQFARLITDIARPHGVFDSLE
ncbi:MAG: alpha/beta fold hydrolase BchO [Pseudomonadota bacterium]